MPAPASAPDQRLGLALGGGGVKGWAHLGVLSVLERYGLGPDVVAGCSAGALIGAYYAFGHSTDDMRRFMREQQTASLFSLRFDGLSLLSNDNLRAYLTQFFGDCTFDDLKLPFYVVCTDLETGREVVLNQGRLVDAVLASSAIPGIFAPVEIGGRLLVDGGLTNNLPVSALVHGGARYTVGVRLYQEQTGLESPSLRGTPPDEERSVTLAMWTDRLRRTFRREGSRREGSRLPSGPESVSRAMEIVMRQLEAYRLQAYRPDVLITPRMSHVRTFSFSVEKETLFSRGVEAAEAQAGHLEELARRLGRAA